MFRLNNKDNRRDWHHSGVLNVNFKCYKSVIQCEIICVSYKQVYGIMVLNLDNANVHEYVEHDNNKSINGIRSGVNKVCHSCSPNRAEQNRLKALEKLKNKKLSPQSSSTITSQQIPEYSKS